MGLPRLLQLCSPSLPVGSYAYSQSLEAAISEGFVTNQSSAESWIGSVFIHSFSLLDLPSLLLAQKKWMLKDAEALRALDDYLSANRETYELHLEDKEMGRALHRILISLNLELPRVTEPSFVTMFGCAGAEWGICPHDLATGFSFSWMENQTGIATKTIPLGQTANQKILSSLSTLIEPRVSNAIETHEELASLDSSQWDFGVSLQALSMLSARHEQSPSRLYRS